MDNNNYNYNYDQGYDNTYNYNQEYNDSYDYNYEAEYNYEGNDAPMQEVSLPPPPPVRPLGSTQPATAPQTVTPPPPPSIPKPKPAADEPKSSGKKLKVKELEGWRTYQVLGIYPIGKAPFPIVNPNYFAYIYNAGHTLLIPTTLLEFILVWCALCVNFVMNILVTIGSINLGIVAWPGLRILISIFAFCIVPVFIFTKYYIIYRSCAESSLLIRGPLYIVFVVFTIISILFYLSMMLGIFGTGISTAVVLIVGGLIKTNWFSVGVGFVEAFALFIWVILLLICAFQLLLMVRCFILYRRSLKEHKENRAQNRV